MSKIVIANDKSIAEAAALIREGLVVGLPTETVYGLGADATSDAAVQAIFTAKGRPAHNPLIIHVADKRDVERFAQVSDLAKKMMAHFWPGALTFILPLKLESGISRYVTAGLNTIAIRMPAHPVMQRVIQEAGVPIAAPSANASGEPSATTPKHVAESLGDNIDFILGAGACDVGLESTVLDLSSDVPTILRVGAITLDDIQAIAPDAIMEITPVDTGAVKSPGQLLKHYAPSIPVRLNAVDVEEGEALLAFGSTKFMGIKSGGAVSSLPDTQFKNLSENSDLDEAAHNLFAMLRDLDCPEHQGIAVMAIPDVGIGQAINERLARAAKG